MRVLITLAVSCLLVSCAGFSTEQKSDPFKVGTVWCFEGKGEIVKIKIEEQTVIAKENCLRVEWFVDNEALNIQNYNKQTEYWKLDKNGIMLIGRRASGFEKVFAKPCYFIKYKVGEKWIGEINLGVRKIKLNYSNEGEEIVETPLGKFKAYKIRLAVGNSVVDRWFSPEVGILKYVSYAKNFTGKLVERSSKQRIPCTE